MIVGSKFDARPCYSARGENAGDKCQRSFRNATDAFDMGFATSVLEHDHIAARLVTVRKLAIRLSQ